MYWTFTSASHREITQPVWAKRVIVSQSNSAVSPLWLLTRWCQQSNLTGTQRWQLPYVSTPPSREPPRAWVCSVLSTKEQTFAKMLLAVGTPSSTLHNCHYHHPQNAEYLCKNNFASARLEMVDTHPFLYCFQLANLNAIPKIWVRLTMRDFCHN